MVKKGLFFKKNYNDKSKEVEKDGNNKSIQLSKKKKKLWDYKKITTNTYMADVHVKISIHHCR